jgi:hypothetical protein
MKENPIDKDKITENPHNLPYAHTVGSAVVKPEDKGKLKSRALSAMDKQTGDQLGIIKEQIELLAKQAKKIQDRILISEKIYEAEIRMETFIGHTYYLYERENQKNLISMIAPDQWGKKGSPYFAFIAEITLLSDHTWDVKTD